MTSNHREHIGVVIFLLIFFGCSSLLRGQDNTQFTQGKVNDSATLSLSIPLRTYPGRGIDLPVSLSYSSSVWRMQERGRMRNPATLALHNVVEVKFAEYSAAGWTSSLGVPRVEFPEPTERYDYLGRSGSGPCASWRIPRVSIHMPDGSVYQLRKGDVPYQGATDHTGTYYAVDGSRVKFVYVSADTWTLNLPDGSYYYFNGGSVQRVDRHGNTLIYHGGTRIWTDTLGRQIASPLPLTPVVGETDYYLPGLNGGNLHYKFKWAELDDSLTTPQEPLRYIASHYLPPTNPTFPTPQPAGAQSMFHSAFGYDIDEGQPHPYETKVIGEGQPGGVVFNPVVLTEITLPDGSKYKFNYNSYAEIDKVVYPTNAFEKYEYASPEEDTDELVAARQPYIQTERRIKKRSVSENGLETDLPEWTYDQDYYNGISTVTAPDGTSAQTRKAVTIPGSNQNFGYESLPSGTVLWQKNLSNTGALLRRELFEYDITASPFSQTGSTCTQAGGGGGSSISGSAYRNPRLVKTATLIFEDGSTSALAQVTTFGYDETHEMTTGVDQTEVKTYHFSEVTQQNNPATILIGNIALGNLARITETTYSTNSTYRDTKHILGVPTIVKIKDPSGNVVSQSEMTYDESGYVPTGTTNAMPTTMKTWYDTGAITTNSPFLTTHAKFDDWGNRIEATDAKGFTTTTVYDTTYHAFPIQAISPVPNVNPNDVRGSTSAFTTTTTYDTPASNQPPLGLVVATTDINGQTTQIQYNDALLRPTKVIAPNGHETITEYGAGTSEETRWVKVKTQIDANHWSEAQSLYDGLGRTYRTQKTDVSDPLGDIFTITCFDEMGRVEKSSNPFRNISNASCTSSLEWTTPLYDDLSRTKKVTSPDSNDVEIVYGLSTTGIIGTTKTVIDQAGRERTGITDALGNMVRVYEGPVSQGLYTDYTFDTLGNLRKTHQGDQSRYFLYDSLGRVLFAKQPEQDTNTGFSATDPITGNTQWSVKYEFDDNGNITKTTDARGIYIEGTYDRLDRLTQRNYSDSTPDVGFYYDGIYLDEDNAPQMASGSAKGKTTGVKSSVSRANNITFDSMGRLTASQQITDGQIYAFEYAYNLSGALIEETYPSTRKVKYTLNADGELSQVQSKKNSSSGYWTYAGSFSHNAAGAVTKMQLGNGLWETVAYNERQQVTMMGVGPTDSSQSLFRLDLEYGRLNLGNGQVDANTNNGSLAKQKITVPAAGQQPAFIAQQYYSYDSLNRIEIATENIENPGQSPEFSWRQWFSYDRYGNRRFDTSDNRTSTIPVGCSAAVCNPNISTSDNRLSSSQGYDYDENGALTQDAAGQRFGYDAESHQKEFFSASNQTTTPDATYHYDGEGRRVKKVVGTEVTIFVYDASGLLAEEYSTTVVPVEQAKVRYLTTDHLGSPRVITDANGAVISRKDFTAFGEEVTSSQRVGGTNGNGYDAPSVRQDYTGYEKDSESGLEFAQARYYSTGHGRFTSVDPLTASATIRNPQTFNRYSYVLNSPYEFVDPLGLAHCNTGRCVQVGGGDWFTSTYDGVTPQFSRARSQTQTTTSGAVRNLEEQARRDIARRLPLLFGDGIPPAEPSPYVDKDSSDPEWSAQNSALTRAFTDGVSFARANRTGETPKTFSAPGFAPGSPTHYRLATGEVMGIHVFGDEFGLTAPNIFIPDGFDRLTDIRRTWLGILNSKTKEFIVAFHIKGVRSNAQFQANGRFHNAAGFRFIGVGGGPGGNTPGYIHSCIKIFKDAASGREYVRQINLATFDFDARRYGDLRKYLR